jgi:DNA-binding NarL/FixJ family response regulator
METATASNSIATKSVFVVEDSVPVRARLINWLETIRGVQVVGEAATPVDAILGILRTHPAYVVLDFQLEAGTGADVLRAVREQVPQTVFIVLTNHAEPQFQRACMDVGADAFFDKSTELGRVKELIARGLGRNDKENSR